jgi:hypothetical protein
LSIRDQVLKQKERATQKYKAKKFIAYFQAFTNTYAPLHVLREKYEQAIVDESIVQLSISTRPDCIPNEVLELLENFKKKVDVSIELGLQTINSKTLRIIQRGHGIAEFVDAVLRAKMHSIEIVVHVIVDLPWDDLEDVIDTARTLSYLGVNGVKLHSLYVVRNTPLENIFINREVDFIDFKEYKDRVVAFLENLSPHVVIHRLASDPPRNMVVYGNWGMSKIQIVNEIEKELEIRDTFQGKRWAK